MSNEIILDGNVIKLGCNRPTSLRYDYKAFATEVQPYSKEDALKVLDKRQYVARQIFGKSFNKNQLNFGSCNGFACAYADEKSRWMRGLKYVRLSGSSIYCQINDNSDNGSQLRDGMKALENTGALPESIAPANKIYKSQYPADVWTKIAYRFKSFECYNISSEADLITAALNNFMLVVAVHVNNNFMKLDSNGVVGTINGVGNHSVNLDDIRYSNGEFQFDLHNSWGDTWGDDGRGWISWNRHLKTTVNYHEFFAIRSSVNDPEDDEFPPIIGLSDGQEVSIPVEFPTVQ